MTNQAVVPEADFSFVRYANCWEDADLLLSGLRPAKGTRMLSIASAGDNALSLVGAGAEVVAVDLNASQVACTLLRREAIRLLSREAFLAFAGVLPGHGRLATYAQVRGALPEVAQQYWDQHAAAITHGFIHAGKFENYFRLFRRRIMPLIHRRRTLDALLEHKTLDARRMFFRSRWDVWRWRWLFKVFFSRFVMGRLGRDPAFFEHVEGDVAQRIMGRTEYALTALDPSANPYLTYILKGNFGDCMPDYLNPVPYEAIKANIDNLHVVHGAIDSVAYQYGPDAFDGFNLSDIFEYLSLEQCQHVYGHLLGSARRGARFAYWNMLVPRSCPEAFSGEVTALAAEADTLFKKDRAFFYSRFVLEEVQ